MPMKRRPGRVIVPLKKQPVLAPRLAVLFLLLTVAAGGAVGFGAIQVAIGLVKSAGSPYSPSVVFVVHPGETTGQIAADLHRQKLIENVTTFRVWAQFRGLDTKLEAGAYHLSAAMTIPEITDTLLRAAPDELWVTIPEGYRIWQIGAAFAAQEKLTLFHVQDFLQIAQTGVFNGSGNYWFLHHDAQGATDTTAQNVLEGFLFPSSYLIPLNANAAEVTQIMLNGLGQQLCPGPADQPNAYLADEQQCEQHARVLDAAKHLTVFDLLKSHYSDADGASMADKLYHALTLASIIEREARTHDDRQGIASVYYKRYLVSKNEITPPEDGLSYLQADPTVQYALGTAQDPWPQLTEPADEYQKGAYDTYAVEGLPPGPISGPGADALMQAINPASTPYYYFITTKDGSTVYARTYDEQQQNIAKYGTR